jgi:hypothetical protein
MQNRMPEKHFGLHDPNTGQGPQNDAFLPPVLRATRLFCVTNTGARDGFGNVTRIVLRLTIIT